MKGREIEIYVDSKFLKAFFEKLKTCEKLSDEFEVYYSFYKIIQQDHVRIIRLESGKEVKAIDIIRVYQTMYGVEDLVFQEYRINQASYSSIENPQSLFFGEVYKKNQSNLKSRFGFVFSCSEQFCENWGRLLLINRKSTIHVKSGFSWPDLKPYALPSNSILLIEPYLMAWLQFEKKFKDHLGKKISHAPKKWITIAYKVTDNINAAISNLSETRACSSLRIITRSDKDYEGDQGPSKENIKMLVDKIKTTISISIKSFENGTLKADNKLNDNLDEASLALQNFLHDRYVITNYHLIISTHSLDLVDRDNNSKEKIVKKNTQLIIQPLLQDDYFDFYKSKLQDYSSILEWKNDQTLNKYLISEEHGNTHNRHFYKPDSSKL